MAMMAIEVCYALPHQQKILALEVEEGTKVSEALRRSGIDNHFPGLDLAGAKVGIFGKAIAKPDQHELKAGDRIEIYRDLIADPKEVRKARAERVKAEKAAKKA